MPRVPYWKIHSGTFSVFVFQNRCACTVSQGIKAKARFAIGFATRFATSLPLGRNPTRGSGNTAAKIHQSRSLPRSMCIPIFDVLEQPYPLRLHLRLRLNSRLGFSRSVHRPRGHCLCIIQDKQSGTSKCFCIARDKQTRPASCSLLFQWSLC